MSPTNRVNAVKEVLALPPEIIDDRFHLDGNQGAAIEYFGGAVKGMIGSAFIYTNKDSISVGVGCLIDDYLRTKTAPYDLLDEFKERADRYAKALIDAGHPQGYSLMSRMLIIGDVYERDYVRAYAYAYAVELVSQGEIVMEARSRMEGAKRHLRPDQILDAEWMAREIVRQ